jgi:hypothetical protein
MSKNFVFKAAKTLLIPALIVTGLTACGVNKNGTRTSSYDTRTANYTGYNYNAPGFNNGFGIANYGGYGVNHYGGYGTKNIGGYGPTGRDGVALNGYRDYDRSNTYNVNNPNQQLASKVVTAADNVPGVTRATAVVQGNQIVVGIDTASNRTTTDRQTLEKQVANVIQSQMPGYSVYVTSDGPLHSRIQNIYRSLSTNTSNALNNTVNSKGITPGHPVLDLGSDLTSIIRDIGRTVTAPLR